MPLQKIQVHSAAAVAIMQSAVVEQDLLARGARVADAAGGEPDFEVRSSRTRDRVSVFVTTATAEGRRAEAEDRALTRAIDAGR